jgi:hypothetical protein
MLNIWFHICIKNDQLNKIKIFLLVTFVEMSDKKKMWLPEQEDKDQPWFATATMMRRRFNVVDSSFWHEETETKNLISCQEIKQAGPHRFV